MNVRDFKLAIACGEESSEVKTLNMFFNNLFNNIKIYTEEGAHDLIYMSGDKFIMKENHKLKILECSYDNLLSMLYYIHNCSFLETIEIVTYKVEEVFKINNLTPSSILSQEAYNIEREYDNGLLIPIDK